ncbi:MAG: hypothetical protein JXR34_00895 [Bacteroidales bacterium]|nr:hypothetical protein [Bacteroidales bacterium]
MAIRRVQYSIDYVHILTFKEEYKKAVIPYFGFDALRYGIDNENTINESIRLVFEQEKFAIVFRKEGISFIYDGSAEDLKSQNGVMKIFWEMYDRTKSFEGYKRSSKHQLLCHDVNLVDRIEYEKLTKEAPHFSVNPFGALDDFACIYEYKKGAKSYKFEFGNFKNEDIKIQELRFLNSEFNSDLDSDSFGTLCKTEIKEELSNPSFSKFKELLADSESLIKSFDKKL